MKIRHERPMPELSYQVTAPIKLLHGVDELVTLKHWSLEGVKYPFPADIFPKTGVLIIPFQGVDIRFVVWFEPESNEGFLKFKDLTGRQRETLAVFYRSILSGKMACTDDIITSLDTPVDLVPMQETEEEKATEIARKSPRFLRIIWNTTLYLVVSFFVFGLIGSQIWSKVSQVSLAHARVVSPLVEHHSTAAAYVDEVLVALGEDVERGQVLVRLSLPEQETELAEIRREVSEAEVSLLNTENRLLAHLEDRHAARRVLVQELKEVMVGHRIQDFIAGWDLDDVENAQQNLRAFDQLAMTEEGTFYETLRNLETQRDIEQAHLARLKRDLGNHKDAMDAVDIVAKIAGTVQQIDVFEDQYIPRGTLAIHIEENQPRVVRAWLDETMSQAVHVGMQTQIRFTENNGARTVGGVISDIQAGIDPEVSGDFGIIVTVSFTDFDLESTRAMFRPHAPVSLSAIKNWASFWAAFLPGEGQNVGS